MSKIITLIYDDVEVYIRESDNYVDATKVCQSKDKLFGNWYRLKSTKDLIAEVYFDVPEAERATMPEPVQIVQGVRGNEGVVEGQGTWLHPDLAIALAAWLNPKFHIWMLRVTRKLLTQGSVHLDEEVASLRTALGKAITESERDKDIKNNQIMMLEERIFFMREDEIESRQNRKEADSVDDYMNWQAKQRLEEEIQELKQTCNEQRAHIKDLQYELRMTKTHEQQQTCKQHVEVKKSIHKQVPEHTNRQQRRAAAKRR